MAAHLINLVDVVLDPAIYPRARQAVNDHHVAEIAEAMRAGSVLPPILVEHGTLRVVDGWHRVTAARQRGDEQISATLKKYASEGDLIRDAAALNSTHGMALSTQDKVHAANLGATLGVSDADMAQALRMSIGHLRSIRQLYATVAEATQALPELRHVEPTSQPIHELRQVPLKRSVRHLEGMTITPAQAKAIDSAPGQSYLLSIRQVIGAIEHHLLPPVDQHPALWTELANLRDLLQTVSFPEPVS